MKDEPPILSCPIDVAAIPATGVERRITATEAERAALAGAYGLREVKALSADLTATAAAGGSVRVEGRVTADIVQTCVVSLEPVEQAIDEPVVARFAPAARASGARAGEELSIDPQGDDPPEPLEGPTLDLGVVAEEYFVLAIDPYPRAPGAGLLAGEADGPAGSDSPFAALAGLYGKLPGKA